MLTLENFQMIIRDNLFSWSITMSATLRPLHWLHHRGYRLYLFSDDFFFLTLKWPDRMPSRLTVVTERPPNLSSRLRALTKIHPEVNLFPYGRATYTVGSSMIRLRPLSGLWWKNISLAPTHVNLPLLGFLQHQCLACQLFQAPEKFALLGEDTERAYWALRKQRIELVPWFEEREQTMSLFDAVEKSATYAKEMTGWEFGKRLTAYLGSPPTDVYTLSRAPQIQKLL